MTVWYPLASRVVNLEDINNRLQANRAELVEVVLDDTFPAVADIHQDTIDSITSSLPNLKSRLELGGAARKADIIMVLCDDAPSWSYIY